MAFNRDKNSYKTKLTESSREYSPKERVKIKDVANLVQVKNIIEELGDLVIAPKDWAVVEVHNEKSKQNQDYTVFVIEDKSGDMYATSSESLVNAFMDIYEEMEGEDEEYEIRIFGIDSKNYSGQKFLTCTMV